MSRPYVMLESENKIQTLLESLQRSLHRFISMEGVVGIILDGGLSRGYGDELSEIDLLIFVEDKMYQYYQEGNTPFALGITVIDGALYDIKMISYEKECKREYDSVGLWDLSYAKILYDTEDRILRFMKEKLAVKVNIYEGSGYLWEAYWNYQLAGNIWIHRGDALQGHMIFNAVIKPMICALFIVNGEFVPHDKWLIHMSRTLAWKPENWEHDLQGAMNTGDFTAQSLVERQACIHKIWMELNDKFCEMISFESGLNFVQRGDYKKLESLVQKKEYTLEEWEKLIGQGVLNYEPFHSIFEKRDGKIVFLEDRFLELKPEDMYVWMYEMVEAVRNGYEINSIGVEKE